jgi:hypothetical protein
MSGIATAIDKNVFEYSIDDCRLRIIIGQHAVTVEDLGGNCSHSESEPGKGFCGSRGYIGKTTFQMGK